MDFDKMHKMLSFGFSDKQALNRHPAVGLYGNGFKSGSMSLGKDAIVFSKNIDSMNVGLLSQTYLAAIQAQNVVVPIVTFRKNEENKFSAIPQHRGSLKAILEHSLFQTEEQLLRELEIITGLTGTRIIIWNLRSTTSGQIEFEFKEDIKDIQIPYVDSTDEQKRPIQRPAEVAEFEFSLRAYCSILYLKPWMQILIRGKKVKTQLVAKSLAHTVKDKYAPKFLTEPIIITFGYRTNRGGPYGVLMYYKNRLIRPYVRLSCQLKAKGVGVIGIIECNFLKPTHNKQEFVESEEYRKIKDNIGKKLTKYWEEIQKNRKENPSNTESTDDMEEKKKQPQQKEKGQQNSEDRESKPTTSATPSKRYDMRRRRGDSPTSPTSSSSSPLSFSDEYSHTGKVGDDPSANTVLTDMVPENPSSRQKMKLITQENKEGKITKMIGHQNDTSEAVASTAASAQNREQVETVTHERDQHSKQLETVIQERDQYMDQVKTLTQERDQYRTELVQLQDKLKSKTV